MNKNKFVSCQETKTNNTNRFRQNEQNKFRYTPHASIILNTINTPNNISQNDIPRNTQNKFRYTPKASSDSNEIKTIFENANNSDIISRASNQSKFRYTPEKKQNNYNFNITNSNTYSNNLNNDIKNDYNSNHSYNSNNYNNSNKDYNSNCSYNYNNDNNSNNVNCNNDTNNDNNSNNNNVFDDGYIESVLEDFNLVETICFSSSLSVEDLEMIYWPEGATKKVEFYTNKPVPVTFVSIEDTSHLTQLLNDLIDGNPMSIDFEWSPDYSRYSNNPISLFQICSSKGVVVILNSTQVIIVNDDYTSPRDFANKCPNLSILKDFISSHSFYGKGMANDRKKLNSLFGTTFSIEDIETTKLKRHGLPLGFSRLINQLVGEPSAEFKDKYVSLSDWNARPLTVRQSLYAAFDAYAIRLIREAIASKYGD